MAEGEGGCGLLQRLLSLMEASSRPRRLGGDEERRSMTSIINLFQLEFMIEALDILKVAVIMYQWPLL